MKSESESFPLGWILGWIFPSSGLNPKDICVPGKAEKKDVELKPRRWLSSRLASRPNKQKWTKIYTCQERWRRRWAEFVAPSHAQPEQSCHTGEGRQMERQQHKLEQEKNKNKKYSTKGPSLPSPSNPISWRMGPGYLYLRFTWVVAEKLPLSLYYTQFKHSATQQIHRQRVCCLLYVKL